MRLGDSGGVHSAARHLGLATTQTDTLLIRSGLQAEAEIAAISTTAALVEIRVLDLEIFGREYPRTEKDKPETSPYEQNQAAVHPGRVVSGLTLIRNTEVHGTVVVNPDVDRVISLGLGGGYRVFPRWKPYGELPEAVQNNCRTAKRSHQAYKSDVGGTSS